ncbi:hypothetical protein OG897_40485 [Streptomyces sp. NBC_00237]|nr:hypothetical protein [Streptomyces sp. NBC_00237]MCX5207664.1 hypothetical protein [Streptomyces sp. NBC_00237]
MLKLMGRVEDGLPVRESTTYAVLSEPDLAGVLYVPTLTVTHTDEDG